MPGSTAPPGQQQDVRRQSQVVIAIKQALVFVVPVLLLLLVLSQVELLTLSFVLAFGARVLLWGVVAFLYLFFAVSVHEVGHLLGGWTAAFRCAVVGLGPVKMQREEGRTSIKWQWNRTAPIGYVLMIPKGDNDLSQRWIRMIAAGPLASLVLALLLTIPAIQILPSPDSRLELFVLVAFFLSWVICILSILPIKIDASYSTDGRIVLTLLREGPEAERLSAIYAIIAASTCGTRPRDWNPALLDRAVDVQDRAAEELYAFLLYYTYHLDREEIEQAERCLARAVDGAGAHSTYLLGTVYATATFHEACYRQDGDAARDWWEKISDHATLELMEPAILWRGKAALQLIEGRPEEAFTSATEGIEGARQSPYPGLAETWIEQLTGLLRRAERATGRMG